MKYDITAKILFEFEAGDEDPETIKKLLKQALKSLPGYKRSKITVEMRNELIPNTED